MNIIVTGASGFIGSDLLRELTLLKYNILALGRRFLFKENRSNVLYYEQNILSLEMHKISEYCRLNEMGRIDVIIHAAGQAHIAQTSTNKSLFVENNIEVTKKVLDLAIEMNVQKFIFLSSVAAMDDSDNDNIYAYTKQEAEKLVKTVCDIHNINYIIIRPVAVYGEYDFKGNVYKLIKQLTQGLFPLVKDGKIIKNLIYVRNLSYIIATTLQTEEWHNKIIIARDKERLTLRQICKLINTEMGNRCLLLPIPIFMFRILIFLIGLGQRKGIFKSFNLQSIKRLGLDIDFTLCSKNEELVRNLPYSSMEGLKRTVEWFRTL